MTALQSATLLEPEAPAPAKHGAHAAPGKAHPPAGHASPAAGGHGSHGGRAHKKKHGGHHEHAAHGPPPWLISFGDMMTLFLCFFIVLVTMADRQDAGLMASGLGPFVTALEYHGLDGGLSGEQRLAAINRYRERFGMPPEVDPSRVEGATSTDDLRRLEDLLAGALRPHTELRQPRVASFGRGSAELSDAACEYLDLLAETLRPRLGQLLILEGHAADAARGEDATWLALRRAQAVRSYLTEKHGVLVNRVDARAFATEPASASHAGYVGARLVEPAAASQQP